MLWVDTGISPTDLVTEVLFESNSQMKPRNIRYEGSPFAIGQFRNSLSKTFPKSGIIMTTGDAYRAIGPNQKNNTSLDFHGKADMELARMAQNMSFDASALEFEFTPTRDSIRFNFVFASEEYPEYVFRGVNDVFAFFLIDLEDGSKRNLALVPNTDLVVSIDNINDRRNKEFYVANQYWFSRDWKYWQQHKKAAAMSYLIEFDGFTTLLEAHAEVKPGRNYKLRIAISDIGDGVYDSAVFLEAGSFTDQDPKDKVENEYAQLFTEAEIKVDGDSTSLYLPIQFEFDSYTIEEASDSEIQKMANFLKLNPTKKLIVIGHTDDRGSAEYNKRLSAQRAIAVRSRLNEMGIEFDRIKARGDGSENPFSLGSTEEDRALNRRVEFRIY